MTTDTATTTTVHADAAIVRAAWADPAVQTVLQEAREAVAATRRSERRLELLESDGLLVDREIAQREE